MSREEHGRLPRRVRPANDVDVLVGNARRLRQRRAVVDPGTGEPVHAPRVQSLIGDPAGQQQGPGIHLVPVGERHDLVPVLHAQPGDLPWGEDLGTQSPRLSQPPSGQVAPGQPGGKPKVVLDARAHARLPAGSLGLDQQRAEPLRGPVHGRGQPGRTRPHDHQVVVAELGILGHADAGCNLRDRGSLDDSAVGEHHQRQACALPRGLHHLPGLIGDFDVEPLVGDLVAPEEVLKLMRRRRPAVAHNAHPLKWRPERSQPVLQ